MKNKDVNSAIRQAFTNATPDILDCVLSDCHKQKGTAIVMTEKKKLHWAVKLAAIAAVLALIIGIGFGAGSYKISNTVVSTISLDVNPSIEIRVNRDERVLDVQALNEDAKTVLKDMDLEGSDLNVAVNAIIGSMVRNGYLTELANSILISVDSKDAEEGKTLQEKLTAEVSRLLDTQTFDGAVLSQTVQHKTELESKAKEFGITVGKAQLIDQILEKDDRNTFTQLANLSIHQLSLLMTDRQVEVESVGVPSEKGYFGRSAAMNAALNHAGLTEEQVTKEGVELDFDDGGMVYEVKFWCDNWEYDYKINALDGTVISTDKEYEKRDDDDPKPTDPPDGDIGEELAVGTALEHAGVTMEQVEKLNCQRNEDYGVQYYDVFFRSGVFEYKYKIAAYSPTVLDCEKQKVYDTTVETPDVDK